MPYPGGIELMSQGKCPRGKVSGMACMFCMQGHMLECHYPMTCKEAQCSHLAKYGPPESDTDRAVMGGD